MPTVSCDGPRLGCVAKVFVHLKRSVSTLEGEVLRNALAPPSFPHADCCHIDVGQGLSDV